MPEKAPMCLTCRRRVALTRGCCQVCYTRHRTAVVRGVTTWKELERAGLTLPAGKPGRKEGSRVVMGEEGRPRSSKRKRNQP